MTRWQELRYTIRGLLQHWAPKPTFSVDQIPDLTGQVCIVTGGYGGIGKEITKALLLHNAKTYVAGRSRSKAEAAIEELNGSTGKRALFLDVNLSSLQSVRKAAEDFLTKESRLNILFNNAAVMGVDPKVLTVDGYDMQFGTNVLGHWYLTELLIPALLRGRESSPDGHSRVITTSSAGAYFTSLHWGTFDDVPERKKMPTMTLYFQSKLGNAIVGAETARRYASENIISIFVNPGEARSSISRNHGAFYNWFASFVSYPTPMGALTSLYAGTMPEAIQYNAQFLVPWARPARCREEVYDTEVGQRLWDWLEQAIRAQDDARH